MPELPEVETIVNELNSTNLIGLTISKAFIFWPRTIAEPSSEMFFEKILGQQIKKIWRRGKFIVIDLTNFTLFIHLRMTGKLLVWDEQKKQGSHEHVRIVLSDGRILCYEDQRKFGKWYLSANPEKILGKLGVEPLSKLFTLKSFIKLLSAKAQQIKSLLLNQKYIAGLGNIYVDEALWLAQIHPCSKANTLNAEHMKALFHAIQTVLRLGIEYKGTSLGKLSSNYFGISGQRGGNQKQLKVFRREGLACKICQTIIVKIVVAQRGTHLCPYCQKLKREIDF